jgi:hypothetical protein
MLEWCFANVWNLGKLRQIDIIELIAFPEYK